MILMNQILTSDNLPTDGFDDRHLWHPYSTVPPAVSALKVVRASGCELTLADGKVLIDGMASWWCAIHGYNHPVLNAAISAQLEQMAHVMFGGLTHEPAIALAKRLLAICPAGLERVFYADSGSVAVEIALKMALQYWQAAGKVGKNNIATTRQGYHGDTFNAMSVCDPMTGMHHLFSASLPKRIFVAAPQPCFDSVWNERALDEIEALFAQQHHTLAAFIIEPIVQGAGGMHFYHPKFLHALRRLCTAYDILLIADEIATGFGRTGKLFACEFAAISPDILCLGKALTGGYMTLAAVLTTAKVAQTISVQAPFMHGPTFMANPLACSVSLASIELLLDDEQWQAGNWQAQIEQINQQFAPLYALKSLPFVLDVRTLGAIAVVELAFVPDMACVVSACVALGIWVRPFGRLVYVMPPFVIGKGQLDELVQKLVQLVQYLGNKQSGEIKAVGNKSGRDK